ncbi:class III poly(R)-hydroxyalkanoic acid synthase subunit PhaE [Lysobacter silvisoli]|uniref:Poly(3-hydroxyalkanoate) polymerase subunit PhaE n=1 Tax=Lysobacter silvisoli TaxID=2293254 RepID=A0A371K4B1_9GAMM|nr:class III poly(R)-hydroxyalkanoic acid synthase subunit PhaE [Lysobacter silvisoli]RDZ28771.1 class III poly(R)-hydroxyalkanoic acid synthase subunit PhaE [Lysobacter silvisoli]
MAKQGFGFGAEGFGGEDFDSLALRYWSAWGEMMRGAPPAAPTAAPGWDQAVQWWTQLAQGGRSEANEALERFNSQARGWFGQIQQLAAQFAGRDASAGDIASAWKQALGGAGANPFADVFGRMRGPGQSDLGQWLEQIGPMLQQWQGEGRSWLGLPAFGFAREHQERWQALAQAQLDYQQRNQAYNALMAEAGQNAFARFEDKLAERSEPGRQLQSARALFDLWIDAAEDAYAEIALSPRFRDTYAELVNSQMALRAAIQTEIEHSTGQLGMPTRTEIDAAHRKIVQLEREVRRLRDAMQNQTGPRAAAPRAQEPAANDAPKASKPAKPVKPASKPAAKPAKAAAKPAPARTAIARPQPPERPQAPKAAAKQAGKASKVSARKGAR